VPVGEIGLRVDVAKGMRVEEIGVEAIPCEVHEARRKEKEERKRTAKGGRLRMRRL
jgi:hypothetical protein